MYWSVQFLVLLLILVVILDLANYNGNPNKMIIRTKIMDDFLDYDYESIPHSSILMGNDVSPKESTKELYASKEVCPHALSIVKGTTQNKSAFPKNFHQALEMSNQGIQPLWSNTKTSTKIVHAPKQFNSSIQGFCFETPCNPKVATTPRPSLSGSNIIIPSSSWLNKYFGQINGAQKKFRYQSNEPFYRYL